MRSFHTRLLLVLISICGCSYEGQQPSAPATALPPSAVPSRAASGGPSPGDHANENHAPGRAWNTESYDAIEESRFLSATENSLSTFSIDVDTASYSNVRRFLNAGTLPPPGAVRIEELINYFPYEYRQPLGNDPFAVNAEVVSCPWRAAHRLVRIGLKGREIDHRERPPCQLVFLIDVSGSMAADNKLPLVKRALSALVASLDVQDRIAIVTYAGATRIALPSTSAREKRSLISAMEALGPGGATNGAGGLQLAYQVARENFIGSGSNRVILCTDGDFNVGMTDESSLVRMIELEAQTGVSLSVLGFGMGNYQDSRMEKLADHGDGNYAYIDTYAEARKVLVEQMSGTLMTIAKDVKIQVEFNPREVLGYRLLGYENRMLATEDFRDDRKDAGEIGAGHTVTALYEIVPSGVEFPSPERTDLKYQQPAEPTQAGLPGELMTVRIRSLPPLGGDAIEQEFPIVDGHVHFDRASPDFQFAAAVAAFGMLLRDSRYTGDATWESVAEWASPAISSDPQGYRREFLTLINKAQSLQRASTNEPLHTMR